MLLKKKNQIIQQIMNIKKDSQYEIYKIVVIAIILTINQIVVITIILTINQKIFNRKK